MRQILRGSFVLTQLNSAVITVLLGNYLNTHSPEGAHLCWWAIMSHNRLNFSTALSLIGSSNDLSPSQTPEVSLSHSITSFSVKLSVPGVVLGFPIWPWENINQRVCRTPLYYHHRNHCSFNQESKCHFWPTDVKIAINKSEI